jgi:hypothetical protein
MRSLNLVVQMFEIRVCPLLAIRVHENASIIDFTIEAHINSSNETRLVSKSSATNPHELFMTLPAWPRKTDHELVGAYRRS